MGILINKLIGIQILFPLAAGAGCTTYKPAFLKIKNSAGEKEYKSKQQFLKEYALCSCILAINTSDSAAKKDASRAILYDLSDDELWLQNTGTHIDSNVANFIKARQSSFGSTFENRKSPALDCISYYKSRELQFFIDSLVNAQRNNN